MTRASAVERVPVDVITALAQPTMESSWVVPGSAQLVLGGASLHAPEGAPILEVILLEEQGREVRVGVKLEHVRFAAWMSRARLLAVVARDQRIAVAGGAIDVGPEAIEVVLRAHAQVRRLARAEGRTQIRYTGAVEVEGWVPDEALTDRGPAGRVTAPRVPSGRKSLMVTPGAIIRAEPRWAGRQLAVMSQGFFVDTIKAIDDAWFEVAYEDGDVRVHGYLSRRDPPGPTHKRLPAEPAAGALVPNATVADSTCLYAGTEPIGFVIGDRPAIIESARPGWYTVTLDTPWGPVAFDARGGAETALETCEGRAP